MSEEEYEGVTLYVDAEGWPDNLAGIRVHEQTSLRLEDGRVKIIGDPVWDLTEDDWLRT